MSGTLTVISEFAIYTYAQQEGSTILTYLANVFSLPCQISFKTFHVLRAYRTETTYDTSI
ncbi:hypothetical protein AGMMS49942_27120 [Spirochaetia bacterium]|nr:hypothetical protein AGMMS49942_27120 [Spirochaetia bacterium]